MLLQSYNVDFGYISLFEVIGIVAAYFVQSAMKGPSLTICNRSQHCNFSETQAESSLMMVYVNRNMLEQLL